MKFIKSGLLTLLVSLFILGGCKNPTGVGLDVDPNIAVNSKSDTATVLTKLTKLDSVISNGTDRSVLGYFKDPVFGTTTANIAVGLSLPTTSVSFGTNPVLDSAVLVFPFVDFYGDSLNTSYTVEVRQLDETLYGEPTNQFYNNKKWKTKSGLIASKTFRANYRDSLTIQDIIVGKKDTVKRVIPQLRIKLDPAFITNNILKADSLKLVSSLAFNNYIKGLYISLNKSATTQNGGLFSLDTRTQGASRLDIFYKKTSTANVIDTVLTTFNITGDLGNAVTELTWDLNGTVVKTELDNPTKNNNILYIKGLNGTQVSLQFPNLNKIKALGSNIAINRAELVLTAATGTVIPYKPVPSLRAFRWDIANRPQPIPDELPNEPRFTLTGIGGIYNSKQTEYVFNFTGYLQDILSGKTINYGTFVTATDPSNARAVFNSLGRSVTGGGASMNFKAKLRIYYTNQK